MGKDRLSWKKAYTKGHPGCLGEEGTEELGRRSADIVKTGIGAIVGSDAGEEVGSHCLDGQTVSKGS